MTEHQTGSNEMMQSGPITVSSPSDEQLVAAAQQGCSASFERLVRRYQVPLLQFLGRRAPSAEDAEDLTQEAFVRALENLHRYRTKWPFRTWLFTIAHRLNLNHCRDRKRLARGGDLSTLEDPAAGPLHQLSARESRQQLWDVAAELLSTSSYDALWLFYVEQISVGQIAKILGRTQVAVKTALYRARKKLAPALAAYVEPAGAKPRSAGPPNRSSCPSRAEFSNV